MRSYSQQHMNTKHSNAAIKEEIKNKPIQDGGDAGPSMDFKHVRVIVWCWDFCSKMAHGLHDRILRKSLRFKYFFFHIGFGCPTSQGPSWAGISSSVHCSVGSRGNLVSGLGFPVGRKQHISWKSVLCFRVICTGLGIHES